VGKPEGERPLGRPRHSFWDSAPCSKLISRTVVSCTEGRTKGEGFHCFTVYFNSLYIMVQLMHLFVIKH
jgi:hypothetical protein